MDGPCHNDGRLDLGIVAGTLADDLARRIDRISVGRASVRDVHKLRSGSRRIEALVGNLLVGTHARLCDEARSSVRRLRKRAGRVRDCDVSLEILARELPAGSSSRPAVGLVKAMLRRRRKKAVTRLCAATRRKESRSLPRLLVHALADVRIDRSRITRALARCLRRAQRLAKGSSPITPRRLHEVRLAIKCLRDTAVLAEPALPAAITLARRAERLADILGRSQDLVVLVELLEKAATKAKPRLRASLRSLRKQIDRKHHAAHRRAASALEQLDTLGLAAGSRASRRAA